MTENLRQKQVDMAVSVAVMQPLFMNRMMGVDVEPFSHILTCADCQKQIAESVHYLWPYVKFAFDKPDASNVVRLKR